MFLEKFLENNKLFYDISCILVSSIIYYAKVSVKFIKKKELQELEIFYKKLKKTSDERYRELKKEIVDLKCFISYD